MKNFVPKTEMYKSCNQLRTKNVVQIQIKDIDPTIRNPGVPIFNTSKDTGKSAKDRVMQILNGFKLESEIPPIELETLPTGSDYKYKIIDGVHRFYCSARVEFTSVPAIVWQGDTK